MKDLRWKGKKDDAGFEMKREGGEGDHIEQKQGRGDQSGLNA